jgi:uncharacterized protein (TIGR03435 family)
MDRGGDLRHMRDPGRPRKTRRMNNTYVASDDGRFLCRLLCVLALAALVLVLGVALAAAQEQNPPAAASGRGQQPPDLTAALKATPGVLGVEAAQTISGKQAIFAWFENKQAVLNWFYSDAHQAMMRTYTSGASSGRKPLAGVADDSGPILAIASLTMGNTPQVAGVQMPVAQIAIELYAPLPGGLAAGGRFAPDAVKVPGMIVAPSSTQAPAEERFEVASIRPTTSGPQLPAARVLPNGRMQIIGVTLRALIRMAYPSAAGPVDVEGGPNWTENDRFDVIAKAPDGRRPTPAMLRALLADRFKLRTRMDQRPGTIFKLLVARGDGRLGPQLTRSKCAVSGSVSCNPLRIGAGPSIIGEGVTMADLAAALSNFPVIGGPVSDATQLEGAYDLRVRFRGATDANPGTGPLLPTALQEQLGLRLDRTSGMRDVVVIAAVERPDAE